MKKLLMLTVLLGVFFAPTLLLADEVVGTVQGLQCVTTGKLCPVGKEDPVIAAERVFVILTTESDYFFVPNLDRAILARNINQNVKVTGTMNKKYKSIQAKTLEVRQVDGSWKISWSKEVEEKMLEELYGDGN